ncbi:hypothetical protein BH23CHL8_BH23CHL8_03980 [soil metagenome]
MSTRIHIIISKRERDAFQARATAEGASLSEWLRRAARERLARAAPTPITTVEDLDRFFAESRQREVGREPEWEQHLEVATRSRSGDLTET